MGLIGSFFRDKTLLLTGATGFLGKALLERILRQLPQVRRIIILIRPQPDSDAEGSVRARLERDILKAGVFNRLRSIHGDNFKAFVHEKVEVIAGDLASPDLGLKDELLQRLASEVDIIINSAALVVFDERLDYSINCNTLGPLNLLTFAKQCRNPIFLHVSTAYVSGDRDGIIPESVMEPGHIPLNGSINEPFRPEHQINEALKLAQSIERDSRSPTVQLEFLRSAVAQPSNVHDHLREAAERSRQRWVHERLSQEGLSRAHRFGWFDTYTFTKAMGEQLLYKQHDGVRLIILRPSIIESSLSQPEPGWIEGFRMSTPILFGFGKGVVPDFPGRRDSIIDFIPVDNVVGSLLASITSANDGKSLKVFHVASSSENPLRLDDLMGYCTEYFRQSPARFKSHSGFVPQPLQYRSPNAFNTWLERRKLMLSAAQTLCSHLAFVPGSARMRRKLTVNQVHLKQLQYYSHLYGDYARISSRFATNNTQQLFQSLGAEDQQEFFFDPSAISWRHYICDIHLPGVKRNVMKRTVCFRAVDEGFSNFGNVGISEAIVSRE